MRIIIKGGVWKNTEDEILKAAISKYGKNQWARISSLLVRKTAKQCKARWMEWLDPAIKKTEWSKDEDEKLLHLAKLMPTQWRTIAPIVGRTANQCLERYQKLLDEAEQAENDELGLAGVDDAGPSADDVRRLRPGEVDPDPENRPARPDPIDMDEDEKEMLSEARARLANTQGKKAKRKARERALEEARRLAILQKKRELKAAGILLRSKPKKGGMDYSADIPFEKQPAAGFYDTTEEDRKRAAPFTGKSLRDLEGKRKQDIAQENEAKKRKKEKDSKDADAMSHFIQRDSKVQQDREQNQISKRRKLVLPGPQVGEAELEEIVKVGQAGASARAMVDEGGNEASKGLLGEYNALGDGKSARTPRTEKAHDNVLAEARNIRTLSMAQTPLFGGENTPLHELAGRGTGFEGVTPARSGVTTANPLATPFRGAGASDASGMTPSVNGHASTVGATPLRTPARDALSINGDGYSTFGETPREQRHRLQDVKSQLKAGFLSLPQPKNEFELVLPEEEDEPEDAEVAAAMRIEDATERENKLAAIRAVEAERALARRSQPVKRGLPRPIDFDAALYLAALEKDQLQEPKEEVDPSRSEAERLVAIEMVRLLEHDAITYPVPGSSRAGGGVSSLPTFADDDLAAARQLVRDEIAQAVGLPGASDKVLQRAVSLAAPEWDAVWRPSYEELTYDGASGKMVAKDLLSTDARLAGLAAQLDLSRSHMVKESAKAAKVEKKLGVTLGGYRARSSALAKTLAEAYDDLARSRVELLSFDRLATNEEGALARRMEGLREEVDRLERREAEGQGRFRELSELKAQLEGSVAEMEMEEAERINEAALDAMDGQEA